MICVTAPTTIADQITGSTLIKAGTGTLTLTAAANTYTGPTLVNGGSLLGTVANIPTAITLANGANVTFNQSTSATLNNRISGLGSLTKTGSAVLTLGTPNGYFGATTISAGTLRLTAAVPDPGLVVHYNMDGLLGAIANGATIVDSSPAGNNGTMVAPGANYAAGHFGQGIQFTGTPCIQTPYSPSINVHAWTNSVWINVPANTSGNAVSYEFISGRNANFSNGWTGGFDEYYNLDGSGNGTFYTEIPQVGSGWLTYSNISTTLTPGTWNMVTTTVSNTGYSIYVNGVAKGSVSYNGTPALMTGTNDYLSMGYGATNVTMDEFQLYSSVLSAAQIQKVYQNQALAFGSALPATTPVQLASGATFDLNGAAQTIDSLADSAGSGGTVTSGVSGAVTLTLAPAGSTTFSGHIQNGSGQVSLALNGSGAQALAGSSTYTGGTRINNGTLVASNGTIGSATGSGTVTLSGGTLASGMSGGSIQGGVIVSSAPSEIAPGGVGSVGNLVIGSLTTASSLTTLDFDLTTPGGSNDLLTITGSFTLAQHTAIAFARRSHRTRRLPADRRQLRLAHAQQFRSARGPLRRPVLVVHVGRPGLHRPCGGGQVE